MPDSFRQEGERKKEAEKNTQQNLSKLFVSQSGPYYTVVAVLSGERVSGVPERHASKRETHLECGEAPRPRVCVVHPVQRDGVVPLLL